MTNISDKFSEDIKLLEYYLAIGVDMAVGEEPINRFAQNADGKREKQNKIIIRKGNGGAQHIKEQNDFIKEAEEIANSAKSLEELKELLNNFDGCDLKKRATQLVFADGSFDADLMIIGEAPGRDEDILGKPFVGRSGQLLNKMLKAINIEREQTYITNIVAWRPPGNRNPTKGEIATCLPFLYRQIELVKPKIILTLGAPAAHSLFKCDIPILKLRGKWRQFEHNNMSIKSLPSLHPAYLLRQPAQKRLAWFDMLLIKQALGE